MVVAASLLMTGCVSSNSTWVRIPGSDYGWSDATIITDAKVSGLRIVRVRRKTEECRAGYVDHLALHGEINDDATYLVESLLDSIWKDGTCIRVDWNFHYPTEVVLASYGGYLKDGFELGRLFRRYKVNTSITSKQTCASSCAAAFLGGNFRTMETPSSQLI